MIQHINFPTHSLGNTLDLTISLSNSNLIKNIKSTDFFSDHALITCNLNFIKHHPAPIITVRRCYSRVNYILVERDLLTLSQNLSPIKTHVDHFTHQPVRPTCSTLHLQIQSHLCVPVPFLMKPTLRNASFGR